MEVGQKALCVLHDIDRAQSRRSGVRESREVEGDGRTEASKVKGIPNRTGKIDAGRHSAGEHVSMRKHDGQLCKGAVTCPITPIPFDSFDFHFTVYILRAS